LGSLMTMETTMKAEKIREAPDRDERQRALDPARSFIVQAPAGSGKTTLLIQRFLRLLGLVKRPEEILAITFTRKAAGEMHCRVMGALEKAASGAEPLDDCEKETLDLAEEALKRDRAMGWNILENPSRLRVQTIDSFSAMLTQRTPLLSRLGAEPAVTERPRPLYEEAARRTLALIEEEGGLGEAVMQILRYNNNHAGDFLKKIEVMLAKRDQWLRHISAGNTMEEQDLRDILEGALQRLVEDVLAHTAPLFPAEHVGTLVSSARYAAENVDDSSEIAALRGLTALPPVEAGHLGSWKALVELLLTRSGSWRSPSTRGVTKAIGFPPDRTKEAVEAKKLFMELLGALQDKEELLSALAEVRRLPGPAYDEEDWKTLSALVRLLPAAVSRLGGVFMEEGVLDFPAVSLGALGALGGPDSPSDLMLLLDNSLQHILVDEFQDTSWTHASLIEALTAGWERGEGRTLFLVGDPMQSIYRFRDADVGLFLRAAAEGLGNVSLEYIRLKSNFRSLAPIVEWVNRTIGPLFPSVEDPARGAVSYADALAVKDRGEGGEGAGVHITLYEDRDDEGEAEDVLRIIRGLPWGRKIAVLGRARTHLRAIVEKFRAGGVDFQTKDLEPLGERPVINDILALERALLDPMDRVAWLAALRAGWCGLATPDLHALCLEGGDAPLWELMHNDKRLKTLSNDGRERLLRFKDTMAKAMALHGRIAPRRLLEGLWTALGGPALYEDNDAMREAERFFEIIEALDTEEGTITPERLNERIEGLYAEGSAMTDNPVHVMTIHGAKGLEFDYVILPGLGRGSGREEKEILYWMERGGDLLLAPMEKKGADKDSLVFQYLKGVYKDRGNLEKTRLLYVAATRAARGLYLLGHIKKKEGKIKTGAGSFLQLLDHALADDMVVEKKGEKKDEGIPAEGYPLRRLGAEWRMPAPYPPCAGGPIAPLATLAPSGTGPEPSTPSRPVFDWAGDEARHVGTVVHRYLYRIAAEGLEDWNTTRVRAEKPQIKAMLLSLGLNKDQAVTGAARAVEIVSRALVDEKGRWILGPHNEAGAELAVTGLLDNAIRRVVMDRTFVDKDGVYWVIDYKTGEHRGGSLERFLAEEKKRYAAQLNDYARLLERTSSEKIIKKGLYYPAIPAWIEC